MYFYSTISSCTCLLTYFSLDKSTFVLLSETESKFKATETKVINDKVLKVEEVEGEEEEEEEEGEEEEELGEWERRLLI